MEKLFVVGYKGVCCSRKGDDDYDIFVYTEAEKERDGIIAVKDNKVGIRGTWEDVKELREQVKKDSVVRLSVEPDKGGAWKLVELLEADVPDKEMQACLQKLLEPRYIHDVILGDFVFNRDMGWYERDMAWLSGEVGVTFDTDGDRERCLQMGRQLFAEPEKWDAAARNACADSLLELANDWLMEENWKGEGPYSEESQVGREEFIRRISLQGISLRAQGFTFWFGDDDIFLGHSIQVEGDSGGTFGEADIAG